MTAFHNIGWTVGNYCNARCGHCYSWKVRRTSEQYLTTQDVDIVVSQLVRLGAKTINLGGNEPIYTNGPDHRQSMLPYIIRTAHESGLIVGLTTNGLTMRLIRLHHPELLPLINDVDFSLDSPHKAEHDANRGVHLFDMVLDEIKKSVATGLDCSIIFCGMRKNFGAASLERFLALAKTLGSELRVNTLKPIEPSLVSEMPTVDQFYEGFVYLMERTHCITLGESCITAFTEVGSEGCPCGTTSFRINAKNADGRLSINPCVYMHDFSTGDLLSEDIMDIVNNDEFLAFAKRRTALPLSCRESGCSYLDSCRGGCTARSYLTFGSLDAKDPYCPQDYEERAGRPALPLRPEVGLAEGVRVHDNYLCTWIGDPLESWYPGPESSESITYDLRDTGETVSGHQQSQALDEPALLPALGVAPSPVRLRRTKL